MMKAYVIGWPIIHSRSPLIHGHWLKTHAITGSYTKQAIEPEQLRDFFDFLRTGENRGSNVTIPHKETALAFVDEPDDRVRRIGALNTVWRENGKLHATSTDGQGFIANLRGTNPQFEPAEKPVTILGAGGSTRALVDELLRQGVDDIRIWNRTESRAEIIAHHFGKFVRPIPAADIASCLADTALLINTTSAGMSGAAELDLPWGALHPKATVADIVYTPLITPFLQTAKNRGHMIVPGLGMLLHQAVVGFEKWFGVKPKVTPDLYHLVVRDIDPLYQT